MTINLCHKSKKFRFDEEVTLPANMCTPQQLAGIKEVFALFDRDGDGFIPTRDIALAIRATGTNPSEKELEVMLKGKEDHMFTPKDFEAVIAPRLAGKDIAQELMKAFKPFDRDNSGTVSAAELKHVMLNLGEMRENVEQMIEEADPKNTGTISYENLIRTLIS